MCVNNVGGFTCIEFPSASPSVEATNTPTSAPTPATRYAWVQLGQLLEGYGYHPDLEPVFQTFPGFPTVGGAISLSGDGLTVAIGVSTEFNPHQDCNGAPTGAVFVYRFSGTSWNPLGDSPIYSNYREIDCGGNPVCVPFEEFGYHVSLSLDGNTLAIGNVSPLFNAGGPPVLSPISAPVFSPVDTPVFSPVDTPAFSPVSPTPDMNLNDGYVRVVQFDGQAWNLKGSDYIYAGSVVSENLGLCGTPHTGCNSALPLFTLAMELSGDGTTAALSYITECGLEVVEVWRHNTSGDLWEKIGTLFSCKFDGFGSSLSLDYTGQTLAVGTPFGYESPLVPPITVPPIPLPGYVEVYNVGASLTQIGQTLDGACPSGGCFCISLGECYSDFYGESVSLSKDGTVLAIGAPGHNLDNGKVDVFELVGGTWVPRGQPIIGSASPRQFFGTDVDLDADGNTVAVGSENFLYSHGVDDHGHYSDVVTVFVLAGTGWSQLGREFVGRDESRSFVALSEDGRTLAASGFDESVVREFKCVSGC